MNVIIAGSRGFFDVDTVADAMEPYLEENDLTIISGTARGADKCGETWAHQNGIPIEQMPANWDLYGKSAGYKRNEQMAIVGDALVAFWDGKSRGTKHMIDIMERTNKPVTIIKV